jgi:manganese/zinc/iron transport system permease protein
MDLHASIMLTAALAAMACTVPGVWLVLRRHSMMGDALSHAALPGIVIAFLGAAALEAAGWVSPDRLAAAEHLMLLGGAVAAGLATAWLTEWVEQQGHVEASAALGVVFITLFALGLFLVRFAVDDVHLDADCVLFGRVVDVALDTRPVFGVEVPRAALVNGAVLIVNLLLLAAFYKELQIASFDPGLANVQGISARGMHYAHLAVTAATVVAAFETVGSILVVGLLVVPAATAQLLTVRLKPLIVCSLGVAALSAVGGHWLSQTLPRAVFRPLGFTRVEDASTSGMIAVTAGMLFLLAWLVSPRGGVLSRLWNRTILRVRIRSEDLLAALYRQSERDPDAALPLARLARPERGVLGSRWVSHWLLRRFARRGMVNGDASGFRLTTAGEGLARRLVRGHRLWETYVDRHFELPADHLHSSAHVAEHYLTDELQESLERELQRPQSDPHGRRIPGSATGEQPARPDQSK